jgi:hypothetical protein
MYIAQVNPSCNFDIYPTDSDISITQLKNWIEVALAPALVTYSYNWERGGNFNLLGPADRWFRQDKPLQAVPNKVERMGPSGKLTVSGL